MGKRVSIVFEETGAAGGMAFNVYLEGHDVTSSEMTAEEQLQKLSPADFWALKCFQICGGVMRQAGVVTEEIRRPHGHS